MAGQKPGTLRETEEEKMKAALEKFSEEFEPLWDKILNAIAEEEARLVAKLTPAQKLLREFYWKIQRDILMDGQSEFSIGDKRYIATADLSGRLHFESVPPRD